MSTSPITALPSDFPVVAVGRGDLERAAADLMCPSRSGFSGQRN
jgi:hypothetical protein